MKEKALREKIAGLLAEWEQTRPPSTSEYMRIGQDLLEWKRSGAIPGLWQNPPVMVTATLDDGWGNGLKPIHRYAELAGIDIIQLGLRRPVREIVEACDKHRPDILGLTILQLDSLEDLDDILKSIPGHIKVVVGGPIFKRTSNDDWHARGYYAARDVSAFLHFLLDEL